MDSSSNNAFQEALQKARQLAAKIAQPGASGSNGPPGSGGMKRSFDDDYPDSNKRLDPYGAQNGGSQNRGQLFMNGQVSNGEKVLDMMLPGNKVGFVIGKGGEMIRNLQDKAGVKMVVYQETNVQTDTDKQLRITGPPEKVDYAKQLVNDLLLEKEMENAKIQRERMERNNQNMGMRQPPLNEYGTSRLTFFEYPISPQMIGLVIGKGGETIRKIQADSGCKVQFDTQKLDAQGNKICQFTGSQECVNKAVELVKEIIEQVGGPQTGVDEVRLLVPASRTGSVIGRGGETIRMLKQQSGCNIELDKSFQSDNEEKCFIIRGSPDKIVYAQQLVTDKVGGGTSVLSSTIQNNPMYGDNQMSYLTSQIYANQLNPQSGVGSSPYGGAPYGYGGAPGGSASAVDPKATQDQYAMWAAYYQQYYQQAGGMAATGASAASSGGDEESVYHQWIEYYKAYGMTKEMEQMEQKLKEFQSNKKSSNGHGDSSSKSKGRND